jgi:hypothetical protein
MLASRNCKRRFPSAKSYADKWNARLADKEFGHDVPELGQVRIFIAAIRISPPPVRATLAQAVSARSNRQA